jgi:hypothetical protein
MKHTKLMAVVTLLTLAAGVASAQSSSAPSLGDAARAAAFYSDAGTQLRNSAEWQKEQTQSKNDADAKQKALDAAKQQYEEMQEQARKAGIKQKDPDASSDRDQNKDKQ